MPALSHANTAAKVAAVLVIAVVVALAVFEALIVAFFRAYGRGLQDKTAHRSVEYLMGRRDSKAC